MGSQVNATCQCGLDTGILIGGGMASFMTTCLFPCLCERCQAVMQVNLLAKPNRCPNCGTTEIIPYDDPTLSESPGTRVVASWNVADQLGRGLKLTDGNYKCPRCGQMTLHFADSGLCWD